MTIQGKCHGCGTLLQVPAETAGRVAKCPRCGAMFKVPATAVDPPNVSRAAETVASAAPAAETSQKIPVAPPAVAPKVSEEGDLAAMLGATDDRFAERRAKARPRPVPRRNSLRAVWLGGGVIALLAVALAAFSFWPRDTHRPKSDGGKKAGTKAVAAAKRKRPVDD